MGHVCMSAPPLVNEMSSEHFQPSRQRVSFSKKKEKRWYDVFPDVLHKMIKKKMQNIVLTKLYLIVLVKKILSNLK